MRPCFLLFFFAFFPALLFAADCDLIVGYYGGIPYYASPPSYYDPDCEPDWLRGPAAAVVIEGRIHVFHYWNRDWYDEAWLRFQNDWGRFAYFQNASWSGRSDYYRTPGSAMPLPHRKNFIEKFFSDSWDLGPFNPGPPPGGDP